MPDLHNLLSIAARAAQPKEQPPFTLIERRSQQRLRGRRAAGTATAALLLTVGVLGVLQVTRPASAPIGPVAELTAGPTATASPASTATPAAGGPGWRIGPQAVPLSAMFATGTPEALYAIEPLGDGPPFASFRVARIDPASLQVKRSAVIVGNPGGLAADSQALYVGVTGSRSVLRWAVADLRPLSAWHDPVAPLLGPLALTRQGLWVADTHGLTRLLGDGMQAGSTAELWPGTIILTAGSESPGLPANNFWAVVLDSSGCPTLYYGTGPNGLGGHPAAVLRAPDCALGFSRVASGPAGTIVSLGTGSMAQTKLLEYDTTTSGWIAKPAPSGSNGLQPSVTDQHLYLGDVTALQCLDASGRSLAKTTLAAQQSTPDVVQAGTHEFILFSTGQRGSTNGPRVQPFTPASPCS
jgi:hypothetical protein